MSAADSPRIVVVGAGAIGSMVGIRLALAGARVTLVGRRWSASAREAGLVLEIAGRAHRAPDVVLATSIDEALSGAETDWLLLTTKAHDVPGIARELAERERSDAPVVTFQNGVGSEEAVAAALGPARVVAASISIPVERPSHERITTVDRGGIGLARWDAAGPDPAPLAAALVRGGLRVRCYADGPAMKWSKLLYNMMGNATSAILGWPPTRTMSDPALYDVEIDAIAEARAVMRAAGIDLVSLPGYPARLQIPLLLTLPRALTRPIMARLIGGGRGGKMPSLYLDLVAGRSDSEIDVYNGAVVRHGGRHGVPTPVNHALTRLLQQLVAGILPPERFHHDPAALLAAL